jgi:hypothetical protein
MRDTSVAHQNQAGSVLAISLVILTAITLISITSLQRSGLQTKIASNTQHNEQLFTTSQSEQEFWFAALQRHEPGDEILAAALKNFIPDLNGLKNYIPLALDPNQTDNYSNSLNPFIDRRSTILYIPPSLDEIALAEGEEVNQRIEFHFNMDSQSSIQRINRTTNQRTGVVFPGLNLNQHTAY